MQNIGKNIRTLRTQKNMSQDELAAKLFVTRQTVSNYETGRSRPDVEMLTRISEVLEVDIHELLYEPVSTSNRKKSIIQAVSLLLLTLLLGLSIHLIMNYTNQLRITKYLILPHAIMGYLLLPGFYVLLGWALITSGRILLNSRPLPAAVARWIRRIAICFIGFYLLCQLPWMLGSIQFPRFWFQLSYWSVRYILSCVWIFLLPGGALGLSGNYRRKEKHADP